MTVHTDRPLSPALYRDWHALAPDLTPDEAERIWRAATPPPTPLPAPERIAALWQRLDADREAPQPDPARIAQLWARLDAATRPTRLHMLPRRTRRYAAWAMAACVALLVAVGVYWWTQPVAYHAPPGSRLTVHLPDGSEAVLNAGTTLRHARSFDGGIRAVSLSGEAFFDVRRDETRPFRIETFNATIHVLGTAFNVRAHPDDTTPTTAVTVESGRVRVQPLSNDAQAVVLEAGQAATVRPDLRTPELVSVSPQQTDVALWRAGGVYLSDVPLTDIFDELERRYNVEIDSDTPAVRGVRRTYHRDPDRMPPTVEPLLEELCVTAGLRYRATANGFIVYDAD